jgi:hypothetical protein
VKCGGVLNCSDDLSNKASNHYYKNCGQYEVAAYMYFTSYMVLFLYDNVIYVFLLL